MLDNEQALATLKAAGLVDPKVKVLETKASGYLKLGPGDAEVGFLKAVEDHREQVLSVFLVIPKPPISPTAQALRDLRA